MCHTFTLLYWLSTGTTSFFWNIFSVGQIVCLHSEMSAREHFKRKSLKWPGFRLRRFITKNLHISKGWHRKQRFVDHIKSFLFFIFVSEVDGKYLLVFAKSFWSSCSGENSDPVALILCLGPKKTWGRSILVKGKSRWGKMLLQTLERMLLNKLLTPRPSQESFIYSQRTRTCFLRKSLFVSLVVEHLFSPSQ